MTQHLPTRRFSSIAYLPVCLAGLLMFATIVNGVARPSLAQNLFDWNNTTNNDRFWDTPGNWSPGGGPPGSLDNALFNQNETYIVSFDSITASVSPDVGSIDVLSGNVTFQNETLNPLAFTVNEFFTLANGAQFTNNGLNLTVGVTNVVDGSQILIDGFPRSGSQFNAADTFLSHGLLTYDSGATGSFSGPLCINVNHNNAATMNVFGGSQVAAGAISIGNGASQSASSSGSLNVAGAGSRLTGSSLVVGNVDNLGSHSVNVNTNGLIDLGSGNVTVNRSGVINVNTGGQLISNGTWLIDGNVNIESGGSMNSNIVRTGSASGIRPTINVDGPGSQWTIADLTLGRFGNSTLNVRSGGLLTTATSLFGRGSDDIFAVGAVNVDGIGTIWNNSGLVRLGVGDNASGRLTVTNGALVTAGNVILGEFGNATVDGSGSRVEVTNEIESDGIFVVRDAGFVSASSAFFSDTQASIEDGGILDITNDLRVGSSANSLQVRSGGQIFSGSGALDGGFNVVTGSGSQWTMTGSLTVNTGLPNTQLIVFDGGVIADESGVIGEDSFSRGFVTVSDSGSHWNNSGSLVVGDSGDGTLSVEGGGLVTSSIGKIGNFTSSTGVAIVTGAGSHWNNSGSLVVGDSGNGTLNVEAGGLVTSGSAKIGDALSSTGVATVSGAGSQWSISSDLVVGESGNGTLNLEAGGLINSSSGKIGDAISSTGVATVSGAGSQWNNASDLQVGILGHGTLNIADGGLVRVSGATSINSQSAVNLSGGRFEFGTTTHSDLTSVNATGGSMAGTINIQGINDLASFTALQNQLVDLTDVNVNNNGLLVGSGILGNSLNNQNSSEIMTFVGQHAIFAGRLDNAGEVNNSGGIVRFEKSINNQTGAFVGGRGVFGAGEGWTNEGVMAFSGTTDVLGDVDNVAGGQIVTSGGATTTFFDDVLHNGSEIRTSAGSNTVIFGEASGTGAYTGAGTVFFEGDLRPGNSPGIIDFEGSVVFGDSLLSEFELSGILLGQYDRLNIGQDLFLDGELAVSLVDGFHLGLNQEFLIADVGGELFGSFDGLSEGSLVGNFGGRNLFISYAAGNGRSISLFTTIPEPGALGILAIASAALLFTLRHRDLA